MAHFFAKNGHKVIGCGTDPDLVAKMRESLGEPHSFSVVDVANAEAVAAWAKTALEQQGAPDLLINNAAVISPNAPLWETSAEEFDHVMDVNVKGVANTIRCFVPAMLEKASGVIVNFSSGWGRSTSPEVAPYCASKYAIEGLTQAFAQELPIGMAAVALNPGVIATDMLRSAFGAPASAYPAPDAWVQQAGPFILQLGPKDNGTSPSVPRVPLD
jgi:NAD(P)-dependent dehydrogenase (short-subunit alcohol dehydrogenase family)